jgi:hypothetical protein
MHLVRPALAVALLAAACATSKVERGVYRSKDAAFHLGPLGQGWRRVQLRGADVSYRHDEGGTILVNASCEDLKDLPLDVLTNQALFGVEERRERSRETLTLDGRAALRTRLSGELDGVPVELDLVVLKKDGCTYDLQLVTGQGVTAARAADFSRFVNGFRVLETQA